MEHRQRIEEQLKKQFDEKIRSVTTDLGDIVIQVQKESVAEVLGFLKHKPQDYSMLLDLTCVDNKGKKPRFEMVYHIFSLSKNHRLRIKCRVPEQDLKVESLCSLWKNANWLEREVYDMFGIQFSGHPDLRRLFMYHGFEGYPLRKDYPLRKRQPKIRLRK
ncbi:MAG: NADH-quinone oxidoreductase subunit C [Candidatus Aminicenantes bacterium]|nr:NADH-quinone oxidoreductase subunit C [Candidatus Aminicenantes bacterium]